MEKSKIERERIDMRFPTDLLRKVEEYQQEQGILTRTAAILELVRLGLNSTKSK